MHHYLVVRRATTVTGDAWRGLAPLSMAVWLVTFRCTRERERQFLPVL